MKAAIGRYEAIKSAKINDADNLTSVASFAAKLMKQGFQDENEDDILISTTHDERMKDISGKILAKVWHISE